MKGRNNTPTSAGLVQGALLIAAASACVLIGSLTSSADAQPYTMKLSNDWTISGDLPDHALLVSLQGIANKQAPNLYFEYPPEWTFKFTTEVLEYYRDTRDIAFESLTGVDDALNKLADTADGFVVWDTDVRTSLMVAFTVAGLENAIVVTEDRIQDMEGRGLGMVEDFRGRFTDMNDAEIFEWALDEYWARCSKDFVFWMGGVHGDRMEAGIADFGIFKGGFFTDLSADPADTVEFALHNRILRDLDPDAVVMGWHSYAKDTEGQHVSLLSSYGLRMEGLNTLPNTSYSFQIPTTTGYKFTNNHTVGADEVVVPEDKVYIACIQTDAIGIGAWTKPGRGEIPYAWEVTMNWSWLFPAQLQFFFDTATPNDYFIGALSGPGYMYPKPIPQDRFVDLMADAQRLMNELDMRVFEVMDYSQGNRYFGNIDLTEEVVEAYYRAIPDAIGFINGYGPAHTNYLKDGRPMLSYDYYLSPTRPEDDAVLDLKELIAMNPVRPYYLTMHVRESSDIARVKNILDRVIADTGDGQEVEVVPLDRFLRMASHTPTFTPRVLQSVDTGDVMVGTGEED